MNWEQVAGKWKQFKGIAQQQWSRVSGNYAGVVAGLRQRTLGRTRAAQGAKQEVNDENLAEWRKRQHKIDPIHK